MAKQFAPGRQRDEHDWLEYPRDKPLRASMYPEELLEQIMTHPAKQNGYLHQDICEFVSKPGETILDPFGGVGTSLISATLGRNVILVEIEDYYADIIQKCIDHLNSQRYLSKAAETWGNMTVIQADNRVALPIPCDHVITSPPYGNDLYKASEAAGLTDDIGKQGMQYTAATQNIGKLPKFVYQQVMQQVYKKIVQSVKVGGTITITHRDRIEAGERVLYIESIVGTLVKMGCGVKLLDKWKPPGSMAAAVNKKLEVEIVEDEDVIIMERLR